MSQLMMASMALQTIPDPNQFNNFLLLGYAAMWLIGMVYIASLAIRRPASPASRSPRLASRTSSHKQTSGAAAASETIIKCTAATTDWAN